MLEHRQATDGRNPFCASPLKIPLFGYAVLQFTFARTGCQSSAPRRPYGEKQAFFFLVAVIMIEPQTLLRRSEGGP